MAITELKDKRYIVWEYERKVKEVEERKEGVKGWGGKVRQVVWRGRCKRARVESGVASGAGAVWQTRVSGRMRAGAVWRERELERIRAGAY